MGGRHERKLCADCERLQDDEEVAQVSYALRYGVVQRTVGVEERMV